MYDYITGKVSEITPDHVVLETADGIGYFIHISLTSYTAFSGNETAKVFVHQVVREDALLLFGFAGKKERSLFRDLLSVSGVGANTARMILSSLSSDELYAAIIEADVNALKGVKGIGAKSAQRIIVDLKDKLGSKAEMSELFAHVDNTIKEESLSALVALGFARKLVEPAIEKIIKEHKNIQVEEVIKLALKRL
jgi:holliday junction DNA helicase RuvA